MKDLCYKSDRYQHSYKLDLSKERVKKIIFIRAWRTWSECPCPMIPVIFLNSNKPEDWTNIPSECEPEIPRTRLGEYSLIALLEYMTIRKSKNTTIYQQLYKVRLFGIML